MRRSKRRSTSGFSVPSGGPGGTASGGYVPVGCTLGATARSDRGPPAPPARPVAGADQRGQVGGVRDDPEPDRRAGLGDHARAAVADRADQGAPAQLDAVGHGDHAGLDDHGVGRAGQDHRRARPRGRPGGPRRSAPAARRRPAPASAGVSANSASASARSLGGGPGQRADHGRPRSPSAGPAGWCRRCASRAAVARPVRALARPTTPPGPTWWRMVPPGSPGLRACSAPSTTT